MTLSMVYFVFCHEIFPKMALNELRFLPRCRHSRSRLPHHGARERDTRTVLQIGGTRTNMRLVLKFPDPPPPSCPHTATRAHSKRAVT